MTVAFLAPDRPKRLAYGSIRELREAFTTEMCCLWSLRKMDVGGGSAETRIQQINASALVLDPRT